ncbi:hypothetical protein KKG22_05535 [Patescibacteria group bacterium]|nr:hypothetical protein [Patescibacteria group bacterium]MBU1721539.1 hypothetical protein [Patescibacteria group bacterium]MBU1901505.1 hypothetical protein [Patescibacteria group bacterium]
MFQIKISDSNVLFSKFFSPSDRETVLTELAALEARQVVFIDTPATEQLVATAEALVADGVNVVVRDHHDELAPSNPRAQSIADAASRLREVASDAIISSRAEHPACSTLITSGEFNAEGTVIVADSDLDGLTGAMKALGVTYEQIDADAAVFDERPKQSAETLSELGWLACRALGTLPPFNPKAPQRSEDAKAEFFQSFVDASQGDETALDGLRQKVAQYEEQVGAAKALAETATEVAPSTWLVDSREAPRFELNTLTRALETKGAKVTVVVKAFGPIAAQHGAQYSLAVSKRHQQDINLQSLLPDDFESSPAAGIISNTTFLLHVSEVVWNETVLPALKARLG